MTEQERITQIVEFIANNILERNIELSLNENSELKNYKINPILIRYLSHLLDGEYTPEGIAKALFYPRVLGTSINTSFGTQIQNMFVELDIAEGSLIKGMDIEFLDKIDNRKKWCQLKSGPNTINSEDVKPLIKKFSDTINLARTNRALSGISNSDFIVGVLYGTDAELSQHYKEINKIHPVFAGKDFWYRVTGFPDFYDRLVIAINEKIANIDTKNSLIEGCNKLADEIRISPLFDF